VSKCEIPRKCDQGLSQGENWRRGIAYSETILHWGEAEHPSEDGSCPSGTTTYLSHQSNVPNDKAGTAVAHLGVGFFFPWEGLCLDEQFTGGSRELFWWLSPE